LVTEPGGAQVRAVVLVLPGGQSRSVTRARDWQLAQLRMIPFARVAARVKASGHGVAVWRLRYRFRGWNAPSLDPVRDTRWALAEVQRRHRGARVILVGHSMGGRAALRCADDPSVIGVCALAPWIEPGEPVDHLAGLAVVIAHGDRDRITDPRESTIFAERAAAAGARIRFQVMPGDGHAMVRHAARWNTVVRDYVTSTLASVARDASCGP
jgi:alpha-beta hydrolase superfamily lysophospholipase